MADSFKSSGRGSFNSGMAGDAMWQAMDQMRASFDKRVGTRMGRGDVRAAVIALLHEGPMHGYQMIREIAERSHGKWKPSAGSVYPTLQMLADEGMVTSEMSHDRKVYSLTDAGRQEAAHAAGSAPWDTADKCDKNSMSSMSGVPKAGIELTQAVGQVLRTGSPEQQEQAAKALKKARRKIYSILAQD
jgi:DNA-binding PadR family transcriptional regulator